MAKYLWVVVLCVSGCTAETVTQADDELVGGASSAGGAVQTGGNSAGGKPSTGGAVASAGGTVAALGGAASTVPACLVDIPSECLCAGAWRASDVAGALRNCRDLLDCWKVNNCGPYDACALGAALCPSNSNDWTVARETYDCSCGA